MGYIRLLRFLADVHGLRRRDSPGAGAAGGGLFGGGAWDPVRDTEGVI